MKATIVQIVLVIFGMMMGGAVAHAQDSMGGTPDTDRVTAPGADATMNEGKHVGGFTEANLDCPQEIRTCSKCCEKWKHNSVQGRLADHKKKIPSTQQGERPTTKTNRETGE